MGANKSGGMARKIFGFLGARILTPLPHGRPSGWASYTLRPPRNHRPKAAAHTLDTTSKGGPAPLPRGHSGTSTTPRTAPGHLNGTIGPFPAAARNPCRLACFYLREEALSQPKGAFPCHISHTGTFSQCEQMSQNVPNIGGEGDSEAGGWSLSPHHQCDG